MVERANMPHDINKTSECFDCLKCATKSSSVDLQLIVA